MRVSLILVFVAISLTSVGAQKRETTKTLDLATSEERLKAESVSSMPVQGGGAFSNVSHTLPLRLTIIDLDRDYYKRSDSLVFQVMIENIGNQPVTLPWSGPGPELQKRTLAQTVRASVGLFLRDGNGRLHFGSGIALLGDSGPTNSVVLKPGETGLVRAPGSWMFDDSTVTWLKSIGSSPVQIIATLNISEGMRVTYEKIVSDNFVTALFAEDDRKY